MEKQDTLLVSVDFTNGKDVGVLIVGRKLPSQLVYMVDLFKGKEAEDLYLKLITKGES